MIKITKHLRINALTVFMFAAGYVFHYPPLFYIMYAIMLLHEGAHLIAAILLGLEIDYVALQPFGANLRLKRKMLLSFADEIILYISGPLVNAAAALFSMYLFARCGAEEFRLFYISNIALFCVNMLPAMPLDGGMIARRTAAYFLGTRAAVKVSRISSVIVCVLLLCAGVYAAAVSRNFTVIMFAAMLLGNIFTRSDDYFTLARYAAASDSSNVTF